MESIVGLHWLRKKKQSLSGKKINLVLGLTPGKENIKYGTMLNISTENPEIQEAIPV